MQIYTTAKMEKMFVALLVCISLANSKCAITSRE